MQLLSRRPGLGLWVQSKSNALRGKSAWGRCRQQPRRYVVWRYLLERSSVEHKIIRPGPKQLAGPQLPCSLGEPQGLDFAAAEVYAPVNGLQLWRTVEKELFFARLVRGSRSMSAGVSRQPFGLTPNLLAWR